VAFGSRSSFDRSATSARGRSRGGRDREPPEADGPPEPEADPESVARQICLHLLEHAPRTRAELATKLAQRGVPDDAAQAVLGRFTEVGLIDDAQFSEMWVTSRHRGKGLAGRALQQELRRKGVDDETAAEAVAAIDSDQERATARALVDRKLASTRGLAVDARVRRLAGMLARKGYSGGVAFGVVREALADEGEAVPVLDTDGLSALD
jgi:regulatory protein